MAHTLTLFVVGADLVESGGPFAAALAAALE